MRDELLNRLAPVPPVELAGMQTGRRPAGGGEWIRQNDHGRQTGQAVR